MTVKWVWIGAAGTTRPGFSPAVTAALDAPGF
jgi:uridylate kinase